MLMQERWRSTRISALVLGLTVGIGVAVTLLLHDQGVRGQPTGGPAAPPLHVNGHVWDVATPIYQKPDDAALQALLPPEQYNVTQHEGTEPPFANAYWNNHEAGIYVDVVSGEPLFSSRDKYDSGTGWPSFTKPLEQANMTTHTDDSIGMARTEVRSTHADSHLGHVFNDGPPEAGGMRYCMNSAALRFIPVDKLVVEGYEHYLPLFQHTGT